MGLPVLGSIWGLLYAPASAKPRRWRILITMSEASGGANDGDVDRFTAGLGGGRVARRGAVDFAVGNEFF